jgi:predicted CxxxxCH...CXXCH cytochrome family protein
MMSKPRVGTKNAPLMIWLFSLTLLLSAGPAAALSQYTDLTCASCHGMPPVDSTIRDWKTGAFQGNHQTHAGSSDVTCAKCHNNSGYTLEHYDGKIQMSRKLNNYSTVGSAARYNKPIFFNQTTKPVLMTCSNVNCHFETQTPVWSSAMPQTPADCNLCHSFPPNTGTSGTSHAKHNNNISAWGGLFGPTACTPCHSDNGINGVAVWTYQHATSAGNRGIHFDTALSYTGTGRNFLPSQTAARQFGACSNTYCHSNGVQGAGNVKVATPVWGVPTTCASCHSSKPTTNAHSRHIVTNGFGCVRCHAATVSNDTTILDVSKHTNNIVEVAFSGVYSTGATYTPSTATCTTACHSNGKTPPTYQPVQWNTGTKLNCASCHPTLSGAHTAHIGTLLSTVTFYNYTANLSSGSEQTANTYYAFGCANCHPTDPALHADGKVDVLLTPSAAGGTLKAKNAATAAVTVVTAGSNVTCFGVYCHSNGQATPTFATAPNWYGGPITGDKCAACHGNSPTSGAHAAHAVGIHYDDIYSGTTGKLAEAAAVGTSAGHGDPAQSTTLSCNICHNTTISVGFNDKNLACSRCHNGTAAPLKGNAVITNRAVHVNGKIDLAFYTTAAVKSKAQLRDSTFTDYTAAGGFWTRTTYKAGAGSFDTAKQVLNNTMYNAGNCANIACHNGKTVNWTTDVGKAKDCTICHSKL